MNAVLNIDNNTGKNYYGLVSGKRICLYGLLGLDQYAMHDLICLNISLEETLSDKESPLVVIS